MSNPYSTSCWRARVRLDALSSENSQQIEVEQKRAATIGCSVAMATPFRSASNKSSKTHLGPQAFQHAKIPKNQKTRCSPRTRMLTRMLMVQMSKHMDMQSRRTLFCNSLFEQSCTCFPCCQSAVWSGKCRV